MKLVPLLLLLTGSLAFGEGKTFEVATVRLAPPFNPAQIAAGGKLHIGMQIDKARVDIGLPLAGIITQAFKAKAYQLQFPEWLMKESQMYDILATLPEGATQDDVPEMLQNLLKERFGMQYHKETKVRDVYALIQGKGPVKFQGIEMSAEPSPATAKGPSIQTLNGAADIQQSSNGVTVTSRGGSSAPGIGTVKQTITPDGHVRAEMESTMPAFADQISPFVDKPIVDQTELKGVYQLNLELNLADIAAIARARGINIPGNPGAGGPGGLAVAASDPGGSSVFESVQKLGLKLDPRKMPVEIIVIDKVEKTPTEN